MLKRRRQGVAAASGLAALIASLLWVSGPAGADGPIGVRATSQYGCSDGGFVVVTLSDSGAPPDGTMYQLGLAAAPSPVVPSVFPSDGGPTTVTVGIDPVTVKLAGNPQNADHIFIQEMDNGAAMSIAIPATCRGTTHTVPDLAPASVAADVGKKNCAVSGQVGIAATVMNNSDPTSKYRQSTGLDVIPYTVLLVRSDSGAMVGNSESLSFDSRGTDAVCLAAPEKVSATYEVRAIGVDGSTAKQSISVKAVKPSGGPSHTPSTSPDPTKSVPKPSTSAPAPTPRPTRSSPPPPASHNPPATSASSSQSVVVPNQPLVVAGSGGSAGSPTTSSSPSQALVIHPAPSPTQSTAVPAPAAAQSSAVPRTLHLAEPLPDNTSRIFVWQTGAALIVLLDALAISALIGGVVWSSKRR